MKTSVVEVQDEQDTVKSTALTRPPLAVREPDNTVSEIDTRRNVVVKTLTTDRGAHGVVVSDDGNRVFIANTFAGTVSTIDAASQRVTRTVRVGTGPGGITYRSASH